MSKGIFTFLLLVFGVFTFGFSANAVDLNGARTIALDRFSGTVVNEKYENGAYEFEIKSDTDSSIAEIEIDKKTGEIIEVEIEDYGSRKIPEPSVKPQDAENIAIEYILVNVKNAKDPEIVETEFLIINDEWAYEVDVITDSGDIYELHINSVSGDVLKSESDN